MQKTTISFIGAGRLGKTLARLIVDHHAGCIADVCNTSLTSSQHAVRFIGQGVPCESIHDLVGSDIIFITVPDNRIQMISEILASSKKINKDLIVVHCSGLLTANALIALKEKGAHILSIHPVHSFADPAVSINRFEGVYCMVEGDIFAEQRVAEIFTKIGAKMIRISSSKKSVYHAGAVMASNYWVTLADCAIHCFIESGITREVATDVVLSLTQSALYNLFSMRIPSKALTGPLKRGDIETIKAHMAGLNDAKLKELYIALGKATLDLTDHHAEFKKVLIDLLI